MIKNCAKQINNMAKEGNFKGTINFPYELIDNAVLDEKFEEAVEKVRRKITLCLQ